MYGTDYLPSFLTASEVGSEPGMNTPCTMIASSFER